MICHLRPGVSESTAKLHLHCALPALIEIHAPPHPFGVALLRQTVPLSEASQRITAEAFVRCGRAHRFGLFVFGADSRPINHWQPLQAEWTLVTASGGSSPKFLEGKHFSNLREVFIPREVCQGDVVLEVSLKWNPKSVLASLAEGPLHGKQRGKFVD